MGVLLLALAEASLLPNPPKMLEPPGVLASGVAALEGGAAEPNMFGAEDVEGAAGFVAPNKDVPDVAPGWVGWLPNRLLPGGGPAGVVEGRAKVLFGAGVWAGVDDPVLKSDIQFAKRELYSAACVRTCGEPKSKGWRAGCRRSSNGCASTESICTSSKQTRSPWWLCCTSSQTSKLSTAGCCCGCTRCCCPKESTRRLAGGGRVRAPKQRR